MKMLMQVLKRFLRITGLDVRKARLAMPIDLTHLEGLHPITALALAEGKDVLVKVPIDKCLHFYWTSFPSSATSSSPFVKTLIEYQENNTINVRRTSLYRFYESFQPVTAAELVGLKSPRNQVLNSISPLGMHTLQQAVLPNEQVNIRKRRIIKDNLEHNSKLTHEAGDTFFGPVAKEKLDLEYKRLINVYESIKGKGQVVDKIGFDNIKVNCLVCNNEWKLIVSLAGQHRLAALAALGYNSVIVQIINRATSISYLSEASYWPLVKNGFLSKDEAEMIFKRIFDGKGVGY